MNSKAIVLNLSFEGVSILWHLFSAIPAAILPRLRDRLRMTGSATGAGARRERGKMHAAASDQESNEADAPVPAPRFVAYPAVLAVKAQMHPEKAIRPGSVAMVVVCCLTFAELGVTCRGAENSFVVRPGELSETRKITATHLPFGLSPAPSALEISQAQIFDVPLVPSREPTLEENQALVAALEQFGQRTVRDDFSSLTECLSRNPDSPWALALETQLGNEYYRVARYSKAIEAWKNAWNANKTATDDPTRVTAHRAASELAMMYTSLGRIPELRALLAEIENGPSRDLVSRKLKSARDGLWTMEHRPEVAFRCGPMALDRICAATDRTKAGNQLIQDSQSTTNGFSARQVAELSRQLGMNCQVAFRSSGAEIILPAVVHWKVGHYAAMIARDGNLLRTEDPTFPNKTWFSDNALDEEASGYFLVRPGPLPSGWREVSDAEADQVWGKGPTNQCYEDAESGLDHKLKVCRAPGKGMAAWNINLLLASLHFEDTPIGYTPPLGPAIDFTVSFNSAALRGLASGPPYSHIAPDWRINWMEYVTDDPMNPAGDIRLTGGEGGALTFTDFNSTNQVFRNLFRNRANLVRFDTNGYELRYPDGSKKIFGLPDGSVGTARKIFMTAVVDPAGNAATIQYEFPGKITSITDAIGQKTRLFYESVVTNLFLVGGTGPATFTTNIFTNTFLVTRAMDPFGRTATFQTASGGNGTTFIYLTNIIDSIGLSSSLTGGTGQHFGLGI